jgi:hypothetical protein
MDPWTSQNNPGRQTLIVDPSARRVTVKESYLFRTKERSIPFADVVHVNVGLPGWIGQIYRGELAAAS